MSAAVSVEAAYMRMRNCAEKRSSVKKMTNPSQKASARESGVTIEPAAKDVHTRAAEDRLRFALGTKVRIARKPTGGTIEIDFGSEEELNRLYEMLISQK
jgi:hypothetical protein